MSAANGNGSRARRWTVGSVIGAGATAAVAAILTAPAQDLIAVLRLAPHAEEIVDHLAAAAGERRAVELSVSERIGAIDSRLAGLEAQVRAQAERLVGLETGRTTQMAAPTRARLDSLERRAEALERALERLRDR